LYSSDNKTIGTDVIAALNKEAEDSIPAIDNKTGLNVYYHLAQQMWEQVLCCLNHCEWNVTGNASQEEWRHSESLRIVHEIHHLCPSTHTHSLVLQSRQI
jgi:hypothetical protein